MKKISFGGLLFLLIFWSSCRSDFELIDGSGKLEFSRDTIYLDTVFTGISSSTYSFKVYNRSNEDFFIPLLGLAKGEDSRYRLNVDGMPGKSFRNVEILARDSIYIFIETTIGIEELSATENQFLYTDEIRFGDQHRQQEVPVITLVKDAVFLYPKKLPNGSTENIYFGPDEYSDENYVRGFFLDEEELVFTAEKPYVIYSYAAVPTGKTLRIEAGARIHFHSNSGLIVLRNASLQVKGEFSQDRELLEKEVIFDGDGLKQSLSELPGQWGSIRLNKGSKNNFLNYSTIKNANIGLWVDGDTGAETSELLLKNVQIYNSSVNGLFSRSGNITAENLVINNSGQASLHLSLGGSYRFWHSTFSNYRGQGYRNYPTVYIENQWETPTGTLVNHLEETLFSNCIIYGNQNRELLFNRNEAAGFEFQFQNCLIKFRDQENRFSGNDLYDFSNEERYINIILNEDPLFLEPLKNQLQLNFESPAIDEGNFETALEVPLDLLHINRTENPDLGAYEWIPQQEEQ